MHPLYEIWEYAFNVKLLFQTGKSKRAKEVGSTAFPRPKIYEKNKKRNTLSMVITVIFAYLYESYHFEILVNLFLNPCF